MIRISRVAERYGTALFQAAKQDKLLEAVEKDFLQLDSLITSDDELRQLLVNPLISKLNMEAFLKELSNKLKLHELTKNFITILARKKRINQLHSIILHFKNLLMGERKQLAVNIKSHSQLTNDQLTKIKSALKSKTGRDILLDVDQDTSLLGGIVINYGSYKLDFSLRRKLTELKHELERLG